MSKALSQAFANSAQSPNTRARYAREWRSFERWCRAVGRQSLPASGETTALYLSELADRGRRAAGIELALVAIAQTHRAAGHPSPREDASVRAVRKGIRRTIGTASEGRAPLMVDQLRRCIEPLGSSPAEVRDRALLLVGWAAGLRRSELVALEVPDISFRDEGAVIHLRRSKTDQEGAGRDVAIARGSRSSTCPIAALKTWLALRGSHAGALFLSVDRWGHLGQGLDGRDVARIVQRRARAAGLDASRLAGHSLRAGLATEASLAGFPLDAITTRLGHATRKGSIVYLRYDRAVVEAFETKGVL